MYRPTAVVTVSRCVMYCASRFSLGGPLASLRSQISTLLNRTPRAYQGHHEPALPVTSCATCVANTTVEVAPAYQSMREMLSAASAPSVFQKSVQPMTELNCARTIRVAMMLLLVCRARLLLRR